MYLPTTTSLFLAPLKFLIYNYLLNWISVITKNLKIFYFKRISLSITFLQCLTYTWCSTNTCCLAYRFLFTKIEAEKKTKVLEVLCNCTITNETPLLNFFNFHIQFIATMLKVQLPQQPHKCITYTMSTLKTNQPRPRLSCSHKRGDANSSYAWLTVLDGLSRTSPITSGGVAHSQTEVLLHPCIWNEEVHWASKEVLNKSSFKSKLLSANSPLAVNQGWHCFVQIMSSHTIQRLPESETSAPYHQLKKGPPIREWLMFPFF